MSPREKKSSALVVLFLLGGGDSSLKDPLEVFSSTTCSSEYTNSNCNLNCALQLNLWVQIFGGALALIL